MQMTAYELPDRKRGGGNGKTRVDVALGLLPQSHIYGLVVICCSATYRGGRFSKNPGDTAKMHLVIFKC
jgi:hypothetical protein